MFTGHAKLKVTDIDKVHRYMVQKSRGVLFLMTSPKRRRHAVGHTKLTVSKFG